MKYKLLAVFGFAFFDASSQEVPDSVIIQIANYNCSCHDSIDVNLEISAIEDKIFDCFIQSLEQTLINKTLSEAFFAKKENTDQLQKNVFVLLNNCQKTVELVDKLNGITVPDKLVPNEMFIASSFFEKYELTKGKSDSNVIRWNGDPHKSIHMVFDIRWIFKTNKDALTYHNAKLKINAENGQPLEDVVQILGAEELHVYRESPEIENFAKLMNLPTRQFNFLFVVKNVVVKIFIGAHINTTIEEVIPIVEEGIKRTKKYKG